MAIATGTRANAAPMQQQAREQRRFAHTKNGVGPNPVQKQHCAQYKIGGQSTAHYNTLCGILWLVIQATCMPQKSLHNYSLRHEPTRIVLPPVLGNVASLGHPDLIPMGLDVVQQLLQSRRELGVPDGALV